MMIPQPPHRQGRRHLAPPLLALALAAGLLAAAQPVRAQGTDDQNLADSLAQWDRDVAELNHRLDELQQEIDRAVDQARFEREERAVAWSEFANGGVLPGFTEARRQLDWLVPFDRLELLGAGSTHDAACGNPYGANYEVPFGSYDGSQILALHENKSDPPPFPFIADRSFRAFGGAWSFEPGGVLLRTVELVDAKVNTPIDPSQPPSVSCKSVIRFRYMGARGDYTFTDRGIDPVCAWTEPNTSDPTVCGQVFAGGARYLSTCPRPSQYWSTQGQVALDLTTPTAPALRFPDGGVEVMGNQATDWSTLFLPSALVPFFAHHQSFFQASFPMAFSVEAYWTTDKALDRNGNRTRYQYDPTSRQLTAVVDPLGRTTTYARDGNGNVTTITQPAFGGAQPPLTWTLAWQTSTWQTPENDFPEVQCWSSNATVACPSQPVTTLQRLTIPDGRSYDFTYGPWGNLIQAKAPQGAVTTFAYGNRRTNAFVPPSWQFLDSTNTSHFADHCGDQAIALLRRRLVSTTVYPLGLPSAENPAPPAYTTTVDHQGETTFQSGPAAGLCWRVQWVATTYPDGKIRKQALCEASTSFTLNGVGYGSNALDGRTFADEVWDASGLREATYYGNSGTIGDAATPVGTMYIAWEYPDGSRPLGTSRGDYNYDIRPTRIVHLRDGVRWTDTLAYDASDIPASSTAFRTRGNVVSTTLSDANGAAQKTTATTYVTAPDYLAANLIRLPQTATVADGTGKLLSRIDYAYDAAKPFPSGAPNLEDPGAARGNLTSTTAYTTPKKGLGPVVTTSTYYDTGAIKQTTDGRGFATTMIRPAGDFAECAGHPTTTLTVTNPLGESATSVADCVTGLVLTSTDPNGQVTRTSYDRLGRVTAVTIPGDTSPTQWFEYYLLGSTANTAGATVTSLAAQREVEHDKDGSASGRYVKTFTDGLGRKVQTRAKVDPATSGGGAELVATTDYDSMGRIARLQVPCFAAASDAKADCPAAAATVTSYDVLGRPIAVAAPGLPAATTSYSGDGLRFVAIHTPPLGAGHEERTTTDVLGHTVETARAWSGCSGCWLPTAFSYDAAGRLLSQTDPKGNQTIYTYDGLGRRLTMTDPDMGGFAGLSWSYAYDNDGNLVSQTDPKGQTISLTYDQLNRVTLRDLPPAGPGEEDETTYYDGALPSTCYSCDDHCATTTDTCDPVSLTCSHSGPACDACGTALNPTGNASVAAGGATGLAVAVTSTCPWSAGSNAPWITLTSGLSAAGSSTLTYDVAANATGSPRSGSLAIAGLTFNVTQAAGSCLGSISPTSKSLGAAGGTGSIAVTASCAWTATSNASWITITSGASGSGNGTVNWSAAANSTTSPRTGTLTVAGQTFTVSEAAGSCVGSINPTSSSLPAAGGSGNVAVTAACAWTATSNASWLTITAGASGSGNGTVAWSAAANTVTSPRSGTLSIAGQTFTVNEAAAATNCVYQIAPASNQHGADGGGGNVNVTVAAGCNWTATPNVSWLHVTSGASGAGNGTVFYSVDGNPNSTPRSGTISIADQTFTANQDARVSGQYSVALFAPQDRYVEVPSAAGLNVTGPFTVEAWVNTDAPAAAQQGIAERYNWLPADDGGFALRFAAGNLQFWVVRNSGSYAMVQSASAITAGWHHVAGVFDGSQLRVYVDGTLDGTAASTLAPAAGTASLKMGARGDDHSQPLDGWIDEVRLSTGALYVASFAPVAHLTGGAATLGLWKFDDATAADVSGHGLNGAFKNGAFADSTTYPEYGSLALDGVHAHVRVPNSTSLDFAGRVTAEAWVKPVSTSTANQRIVVHSGTGGYSLKILSSGRLKFTVASGTATDGVTGNTVITPNVWHHVAGVYDGTQTRVYVDGVLDGTATPSVVMAAGSSELRIGIATDDTEPFNGKIDEVRVSKAVVYTGGFTPDHHLATVSGTRGLWRFDRAYVSDSSLWGNHGAFYFGAGIALDAP